MAIDFSKPWTVTDLDAAARAALKAGSLPRLSMELNVWCKLHEKAGLLVSRLYESDILTLKCAQCGIHVLTLKIAQE